MSKMDQAVRVLREALDETQADLEGMRSQGRGAAQNVAEAINRLNTIASGREAQPAQASQPAPQPAQTPVQAAPPATDGAGNGREAPPAQAPQPAQTPVQAAPPATDGAGSGREAQPAQAPQPAQTPVQAAPPATDGAGSGREAQPAQVSSPAVQEEEESSELDSIWNDIISEDPGPLEG